MMKDEKEASGGGGGGGEESVTTATTTAAACSNSNNNGLNGFTRRFRWFYITLIVLVGAAASAAFLAVGIVGATNEQEDEFRRDAEDMTQAIASAWADYEMFGMWIHESCHRVVGDPTTPPEVDIAKHVGFCSQDEFERLYEYVKASPVGLSFVAMHYIPNITHALRGPLEEQSRRYYRDQGAEVDYVGIKEYVMTQEGTIVNVTGAAERPFYFPVHYLLPLENNEPAVEIDLYPLNKDYIHKSIETRRSVIGKRFQLFNDPDPRIFGVIFVCPGIITRQERERNPYPDRRKTAFSMLSIRIPDLIERASRFTSTSFTVYLFENTTNFRDKDGSPLFLAAAATSGVDAMEVASNSSSHRTFALKDEVPYLQVLQRGGRQFSTQIDVADHKWLVVIQPLDGMYQTDLTYILLGGIVIFVACVILAFWLHTHLNRIEKTNRIKTDAEAEKARIALHQAQRERHINDFIAHEVRNPLCSAIAAMSFLSATTKERVMDNNTRDALLQDAKIVDGSLNYINDLLKNMLDINRTGNNEMKLDVAPTCILEDIYRPSAAIILTRSDKVDVIIDCPEGLVARVDRLRVQQVIMNLAVNATKFCENGFIRLRGEVVNGNIRLSVEDSGPGVPQQKRHRLFEKFQDSLDMRNQGTGIGLFICQNLTELMGGTIWLDESYDSGINGYPGARFVIDLNQSPIQQKDSDRSLPTAEVSTKSGEITEQQIVAPDIQIVAWTPPIGKKLPGGLSVLFVDDDRVLRKLFVRSLLRVAPNWEIEEAPNGETALQLVSKKEYDIIFMDQYMQSDEKQLLGTETVEKLRAKGVKSVICGLSANDLEREFVERGANAFMTKPFPCEKEALQEELVRVAASGSLLE